MKHYFSEHQDSELRLKIIKVVLREKHFEFYTGSGVFSKDKIDKGSEILINSCTVKANWKVLDLGCGYGPVGITIARCFPDSSVFMSDFNKRAVKLAKMNIRLNNITNAKVKNGDIYEKIDSKFDTIIVNPPQKAGKDICFKIIEEAPDYLEDRGLLQVVARHNKGGKTLMNKMKEVFGNVADIAKKSGYRVYVSNKG